MNSVLKQITGFLTEIGICFAFEPLPHKTFLPGIELRNGTLLIDREKLSYPGDVLHEAGHLACMPAEIRATMSGDLPNINLHNGGEMMAIAWSYAACIHLQIDPAVVFHEYGYKGNSTNLLETFKTGKGPGIPLLQWCGMSYEEHTAAKLNTQPYPAMLCWTCPKNMYSVIN